MNRRFAGAAALWLLGLAAAASAQEWNPLDARSRSLGGAGVAFADGPGGSYWNPAVLADGGQKPLDFSTGWGFDFSLGVDAALVGDVVSNVQYAADLYDELDLQAIQADIDANTHTATDVQDAIRIVDALSRLDQPGEGALVQLGQAFHVRFGPFSIFSRLTGTSAADPVTDLIGVGFSEDAFGFYDTLGVPGALSPEGASLRDALIASQPALAGDADGDGASDAAELAFHAQQGMPAGSLSDPAFVQALALVGASTVAGTPLTLGENQSGFILRGMVQEEIGVGFGLPVIPSILELGLALKVVITETTYARVTETEMEEDDFDEALQDNLRENRKRSFDLNLDLGARVFPTPWLAASLAARNVIPTTVDIAGPEGHLRTEPQVRAGLMIQPLSWLRLGGDLDLLESDSDLLPGYSWRYVGAGAELDFSYVKLRAGYRENLADDSGAIVTGGLGFRIASFFIDLGAQVGLERVEYDPASVDGTEAAEDIYSRAAFGLTFGVDTSF